MCKDICECDLLSCCDVEIEGDKLVDTVCTSFAQAAVAETTVVTLVAVEKTMMTTSSPTRRKGRQAPLASC